MEINIIPDQLVKSCNGLTASQGGLNLVDFRKNLVSRLPKKYKNLNSYGREELQKLCEIYDIKYFDTKLNLSTFNVLANTWIHLEYYPKSSYKFLEKDIRLRKTLRTLRSLGKTNDVIALQETEMDLLPLFNKELKKLGFELFHSNHDDNYWDKYIIPGYPFVSNGVTLAWKKDKLSVINIDQYNLSDDGNRCIIGLFKLANEKLIRIACVHLDGDTHGKRIEETKSLIANMPLIDNVIDIIIGDLNYNYNISPENNIFFQNNFHSILKYVGKDEPTHPFSNEYKDNDNLGIIDHILIRNTNYTITVDGHVINYQLFSIVASEEERANLLLDINGSDHFPVTATITIK